MATLYPSASRGSRGKASSTHLVSWRHTICGWRADSQATRGSRRCLMELTFQVAISMTMTQMGAATMPYRSAAGKRRNSRFLMGFPRRRGDTLGAANMIEVALECGGAESKSGDSTGTQGGATQPGPAAT